MNILNKEVRMYYGSGTGVRCCIWERQTMRLNSPDGSAFLREMTSGSSSGTYDVILKSGYVNLHIYLKTKCAKSLPIRFVNVLFVCFCLFLVLTGFLLAVI